MEASKKNKWTSVRRKGERRKGARMDAFCEFEDYSIDQPALPGNRVPLFRSLGRSSLVLLVLSIVESRETMYPCTLLLFISSAPPENDLSSGLRA
jgi:hypothetical protein